MRLYKFVTFYKYIENARKVMLLITHKVLMYLSSILLILLMDQGTEQQLCTVLTVNNIDGIGVNRLT